jgi:hypothetical protein
MKDEDLIVQSGSFIAASTEIDVSTDWGGAETFFSGEGCSCCGAAAWHADHRQLRRDPQATLEAGAIS